ncbi:MAG: HAMP domain-containing methyl-accepting chemotaxis protein [Sporomusaceae bacterium]|nr:HAMP domain-containing methyl-accepting chemotaxis protein [Sporomusaceae bacterium]
MDNILEQFSLCAFSHSSIVRWWFNLRLSWKLVLAFTVNGAITMIAGFITYYFVKEGTEFEQQAVLGLIALASLLNIVYGCYIAYLTTAPIRRSVQFAETVAHGDLTPNLSCMTEKDEIGQLCKSLNIMVNRFRSLVGDISQGVDVFDETSTLLSGQAEATMQAAQEVIDAVSQVAAGSQSQAERIDEIKAAIDKMLIGLKNIERSVQTTKEAAGLALQIAQAGTDSVEQTNSQMVHIHQSVEETNQIILELGNKSALIGGIIETIKAISDQTNLLALNAAIEAARAGEHGRGFSVVAEEVRRLAEQSTLSSSQIGIIIQDIQHNVERAVSSMKFETEVVMAGSQVIQTTQQSFHRIVDSAKTVNQQIGEVFGFANTIAVGSDEVSDKMNEIAHIALESSAQAKEAAANGANQLGAMQEVNASASELSDAAHKLQRASRQFKLA